MLINFTAKEVAALTSALHRAIDDLEEYLGGPWAETDYADDPETLENLRNSVEMWRGLLQKLLRSKSISEGEITKSKFEEYLPFIEDGSAIAIVWMAVDIEDRALERGFRISYEDAKEILSKLYKNHNAGIGINWDVIDVYLDDYDPEMN